MLRLSRMGGGGVENLEWTAPNRLGNQNKSEAEAAWGGCWSVRRALHLSWLYRLVKKKMKKKEKEKERKLAAAAEVKNTTARPLQFLQPCNQRTKKSRVQRVPAFRKSTTGWCGSTQALLSIFTPSSSKKEKKKSLAGTNAVSICRTVKYNPQPEISRPQRHMIAVSGCQSANSSPSSATSELRPLREDL